MATEAVPAQGSVLEATYARLIKLAVRHRDDEVAPVALLIPDEDGTWSLLARELHRRGLPAYTLGDYDAERGVGPAVWLRMVADTAPAGAPPLLVLSGVRPTDIRVQSARADLRTLVDVAMRGRVLLSRTGRALRFEEFFADAQDGLGLRLHGAAPLSGVLPVLFEVPVAELRDRTLRPIDLRGFVLGHDPDRRLLEWLDDDRCPWIQATGPEEWEVFRAQCRDEWGFDPDTDGALSAVELLVRGGGAWERVWSRFADGAARYPGLVARMRGLEEPAGVRAERLPAANARRERELAEALRALPAAPDAVAEIDALELAHGARRASVWAALGKAPLATALGALVDVARAEVPRAGSAGELRDWWATKGYAVDDACLNALAVCAGDDDRAVVAVALARVYAPWLDELARRYQELVLRDGAPPPPGDPHPVPAGTCVVFIDGLRGDIAHRLTRLLAAAGSVSTSWRAAPLPTITPTGKPAVVPVPLTARPGRGFELVGDDGTPLTADHLRRTLRAAGWTIVDPAAPTPAPTGGRGWCELRSASLDELGHNSADRFAERIPALLDDIVRTVRRLISAGWPSVRIVTDHGFLYVPGGFSKVDLPQHLTAARKPRCARLIAGADTQPLEAEWSWAPGERIAFPTGSAVFERGSSYEHGGISLQECVVPTIDVRPQRARAEAAATVLTRWAGLRCYVSYPGAEPGATADLRAAPADAASSLARAPRALDETSTAALVLDEDKLEGAEPHDVEVWAVVCGLDGQILAQRRTKAAHD